MIAPATHIQQLFFDAAVDGGTFKLWVNGETTAAITMTGTAATDIASINSALDALPNLSAGDIVASGTVITDITLTATGYGNGFLLIEVVENLLTQTVPNSNETLITQVTTQGSDWLRVSGDASSFNWNATSETVDVTAISEYERTEIPVAEAVEFDLSLYKLQAGESILPIAMRNGEWGVLRLFPEGKIVAKEFYAMRALISEFSEDYPDHETVEQEVSGMRQGEWVNRPGSIWRG
jgi:hypothetical protein